MFQAKKIGRRAHLTLALLLFIPLQAARKSEAVWERLQSQQNKLTTFMDRISSKQLQVDRKLFAIDRSLDHEATIVEQRGKFLSDAGRKKVLSRVGEMEEWCQEVKQAVESTALTLGEAIDEANKLLRVNGLMPKKHLKGIPVPQGKNWKEQFRGLTKPERQQIMARLSAQLGAVLRREKELTQVEELAAQILGIDAKIKAEKHLITQLARRRAINSKSVVITRKTAEVERRIAVLEAEKVEVLAQVGELSIPLSQAKAHRDHIEREKRLFHNQLSEMMAEHGKIAPEKKKAEVPIEQLAPENAKIVRETLKLLDKARESRDGAQGMLECIDGIIGKAAKIVKKVDLKS